MPDASPVTIAIDAVGGDHAPDAILEGAADALAADPDLHVVAVGPADVVNAFAASTPRTKAVVAAERVGMDEHPAHAVRSKKDSSLVVGCGLVRDKTAQGFFSAGNTGAMMAASTLVIGRIEGVSRPAIAAVLPTPARPLVLLDVGANADCRSEHIFQFAHMGVAYAAAALGVESPTVGLLNIGEEATKGSALAQEAHEMLRDLPGFVGNVEGRDIPEGTVDVVVTDGFTGNVALKLIEGLSSALFRELSSTVSATPVTKAAGLLLRPSLRRMRDRLDPDSYGAAPLLGVDGLSLIGHGASSRRAVASALRVGATAVRGGLVDRIAQRLQSERA